MLPVSGREWGTNEAFQFQFFLRWDSIVAVLLDSHPIRAVTVSSQVSTAIIDSFAVNVKASPRVKSQLFDTENRTLLPFKFWI